MEYIDKTILKLEALKAQDTQFEIVAEHMLQCLLNHNTIYFFGTGHSHMIAEEVYVRAGAFAPFQAILIPELMLHESPNKSTDIERLEGYGQIIFDQVGFKPGDMLIIISNSGRNAVPLQLCSLAKEIGVKTVAITSFKHSKNVSPRYLDKRLMDLCDIALDNLTEIGDAEIKIHNTLSIAPLSTVTGSAIVNTLQVKLTHKLLEKGFEPEIFLSSNVEDTQRNKHLFEKHHGVKS